MNLREGGQTWKELAGRRGGMEMLLVLTGTARKVKKLFLCIVTIINGDIQLKMQRCWMDIKCSHHKNNKDVCFKFNHNVMWFFFNLRHHIVYDKYMQFQINLKNVQIHFTFNFILTHTHADYIKHSWNVNSIYSMVVGCYALFIQFYSFL